MKYWKRRLFFMTKCAYCHLEVERFNPERTQRGLEVFHAPCLRKQKQKEQQAEQAAQMNSRVGQLRLRFDRVH